MKQIFTPMGRYFKTAITALLLSFLLLFGKVSSAHTILYFTQPCFTQGANVTVGIKVILSGVGSYYHWQYRTAPGGTWTWLANGNNSINGRVFSVANASLVSNVADYAPDLVISNVGSPAYTTQLDNVELRVIMTYGLDPQTNPYPGTAAWGAEEFANSNQAKYIRLMAKAPAENCYSNCSGNALVIPTSGPESISNYYGGFETGNGAANDNFSTPGTYGATSRAATDITKWTGGSLGTSPRYRVISNADSMNSAFTAFAPHTGNQMLVVSRNNSVTNRLWYRTIAVPNAANFYNGSIVFKAWFAKVDATDACMVLEVKGATTQSGTVASFSGNSISQSITGAAGNWIQVTYNINLPQNTYKKLEFSIHSCNASVASVAIDDICLVEPIAAAPLPVTLLPLQGSYADGIAHLTWATQQESNSSYFEIERSTNGTDFTTAGKVFANGNSSRLIAYKFDDAKAAAGVNYYRLRMVDNNGYFEYSNIISLTVNIKGLFVTGAYPSPFTDKVNISISSENATRADIRLYDITGRVLAIKNAVVNKGITTISLDNLGNLTKGMYVVEVNCGGKKFTERMIK